MRWLTCETCFSAIAALWGLVAVFGGCYSGVPAAALEVVVVVVLVVVVGVVVVVVVEVVGVEQSRGSGTLTDHEGGVSLEGIKRTLPLSLLLLSVQEQLSV